MAIFMVSSVGCGLANSFWTLLACRIVMGAGEASIINLTGEPISFTIDSSLACTSRVNHLKSSGAAECLL